MVFLVSLTPVSVGLGTTATTGLAVTTTDPVRVVALPTASVAVTDTA